MVTERTVEIVDWDGKVVARAAIPGGYAGTRHVQLVGEFIVVGLTRPYKPHRKVVPESARIVDPELVVGVAVYFTEGPKAFTLAQTEMFPDDDCDGCDVGADLPLECTFTISPTGRVRWLIYSGEMVNTY